MLNSEIDMIEEQNKNIEAEIQRHEELGDMTDKEKEVVRQKISQQIDEMDNQMKEKDLQIKNIEQQMITIKQFVHSMCDNFKRSHFFLSVAQNAQYDEDTQFNENNVISYLAELEEYISLFITYLAYKQENPDAAISSLSLEKMAIKEFDKDKLIIDAPNSNDIGMMNDDMERMRSPLTQDSSTRDSKICGREKTVCHKHKLHNQPKAKNIDD
jgi:vacuolar-type H+-ATPase subunit I/STV1